LANGPVFRLLDSGQFDCGGPAGLENWRFRARIRQMAKAWKFIALVDRLGGGPPAKQYFVVAIPDQTEALAGLRVRRPDLEGAEIKVVGEAPQSLLDEWNVQEDEVFCSMAIS
jgi:hypothetical protein